MDSIENFKNIVKFMNYIKKTSFQDTFLIGLKLALLLGPMIILYALVKKVIEYLF